MIIGPESTGKSTLCEQLADYYSTMWVKEYAREYLDTYGTKYTYEDLYKIAEGQMKNEKNVIDRLPVRGRMEEQKTSVFIDTDLYVIKVWSEFVFNKCDNRILTAIANCRYDLYLLCNIDLAWIKDSMREYPNLRTREKLFYYYKEALVNESVPWATISGNYQERFRQAVAAVDNILSTT